MAENFLDFNTTKREKLRKIEIQNTIKKMRQDLPVYNIDEIREYKMPYFDALLINLEEKGFPSSASFVNQLVEYQTKAREEAGPGSNIWMRPQLRDCHKELKYLSEELQKAEEFHYRENYLHECDTFLRLGIYFAFSHQDWWWLGEQILVQSINVSGNYPEFQGKFEALSRFAYAKFLIVNLREYENGKEQLLIARDLCTIKEHSIKSYFPDETGTLYMRINFYTYKCLIKEARNLMATDYRRAIEIAVLAKKRAAEACYKEGETNALSLKGLCEMNIDDPKAAIVSFNKALKVQEERQNNEGMCKVMIQLAKVYLMDDNRTESLRVLNALKETAAKHNLHFYVAQAYKNLGEYYLNNGQYGTARGLLNNSLKQFEKEANAGSDMAQVQILEAIAWGLELLPTYIDLICTSGSTFGASGIQNLNKLIDWKDSRKPFWDESLMTVNTSSFINMMTTVEVVKTQRLSMIEDYKEQRKMEKARKVNRQSLVSEHHDTGQAHNTKLDVDNFIRVFMNTNLEELITKDTKERNISEPRVNSTTKDDLKIAELFDKTNH